MNFQCFYLIAVLAFIVGLTTASNESARDEIMRRLFGTNAAPLKPEESLELMKKLEQMWDEDPGLADDDELRRYLINSCVIHSRVNELACNENRFYSFRFLADKLAPYPNMLKFIKHYETEKLAICTARDPKFHVDFDAIDARIKDENEHAE